MAVRQNFYNGLYVYPDHLNDMQSYTDHCDSELVSGLLGYGIVNGFEAVWTSEMGRMISVTPGLAYSPAGVRLKSDTVKSVSIRNEDIAGSSNRTIALGLKFKYDESEEATDSQNKLVNTVWTPTVELVLGSAVTGDVLRIADIKLEAEDVSDDIKEVVQNGQRFVNLMKQIENTQAFSTTKNEEMITANIQGSLISLLAQNKISLDASVIDLRVGDTVDGDRNYENLLINGTPYMEIGSNNDGHYVKFESGLLVCISHLLSLNTTHNDYERTNNWVLPHQYVNYVSFATGVNGIGAYNFSTLKTVSESSVVYVSSNSWRGNDLITRCKCCAVGFWK